MIYMTRTTTEEMQGQASYLVAAPCTDTFAGTSQRGIRVGNHKPATLSW